MKIVVISDSHGRDKWKEQVKEPADKYIFIGDYFDSFNIDGVEQMKNFKEITEFYRNNKDKVILLSGNHDCPNYCMDNFYGACSGFQNNNAFAIRNLLQPLYEAGDIKACVVIGDYIFVHAGISKTWCETYNIDVNDLEKEVNNLFSKNLYAFCFQDNPFKHKMSASIPNGYGDDIFQSPLWIRPYSLKVDKLDNYTQIVGHTFVKDIVKKDDIWFTDCQEKSDNFLILEI